MPLPSMAMILLIVAAVVLTPAPTAATTSTTPNPRAARLFIFPDAPAVRRPEKKSLVLTCRGINAEPTLFSDLKWFDMHGEEIREGFHDRNVRVEAESDGLLLVFDNPTRNNDGRYRCTGKFQATEFFNRETEVIFYQDITFDNCPSRQALVKGQHDAVIRCSISAQPAPIITWKKDHRTVSDNRRYSIGNNGITVNEVVTDEDSGRYSVNARVEQTGETIQQIITVEVHDIPHVEHVSQARDALEGEEVSLQCHATGIPPPLYTWYDPQRRNLSEVGGYYVDREHGLLTITKVRRLEDNGLFRCLAENAAGRAEREHNLQVITRPTVTSFENITFVRNSQARFECRATGYPLPKLSIRKDGSDALASNRRDEPVMRQYTLRDEVVLEMTLDRVQRTDDGLYYCSAENKAGRVDRVGHLTVEFSPDLSSTNTLAKTWDGHRVNLSCIAEAMPNATIKWWYGSRELYGDPADGTYQIFGTQEGSNLLVQPLGRPGSGAGNIYGTYRCEATNTHGSNSLDIRLEQAHTPDPPGPITKIHDTPTTITFNLGYPTNDGGMPVQAYSLYYREQGLNEERAVNFSATGLGPYKLEYLQPRRTYYIRFASFNDVGRGPLSPEQIYQMPFESAPEPVPITNPGIELSSESGLLESSSSHDFLLLWKDPVNNGREIYSYTLKYYRVVRSDVGWRPVSQERTEHLRDKNSWYYYRIRGLDASAYYRIELRATNKIGDSQPSTLVFKTAPGTGPTSSRFITNAGSLTLIFGVVLLVLAIILIAMDVIFYYKYRTGALYFLCHNLCGVDAAGISGDNKEKAANVNVVAEQEREANMRLRASSEV